MKRIAYATAVFGLLLVAGYFFFVRTAVGQWFDDEGYFGHDAVNRMTLGYDGDLLGVVSVKALLIVMAVLGLFALVRRRFIDGFFALAAFSGAVVGAEILKHTLPRQQLVTPPGKWPPYFSFDTYPSGHTTIATSFVLGLIFVAPSKWRPWLASIGGLVSASYATAVLFCGWHRPSDAVGGILWSGFCFGIAALFTHALHKDHAPPARLKATPAAFSLGFCCGALVLAWLATGWMGPRYPDADYPFLVMTVAIVIAAFGMAAWYGWVLKAER